MGLIFSRSLKRARVGHAVDPSTQISVVLPPAAVIYQGPQALSNKMPSIASFHKLSAFEIISAVYEEVQSAYTLDPSTLLLDQTIDVTAHPSETEQLKRALSKRFGQPIHFKHDLSVLTVQEAIRMVESQLRVDHSSDVNEFFKNNMRNFGL